jgi:RNA ligase
VIRSRPFAKFFNYGERTLEIPNGPVALYDKPDGSLATLFHDGDRWRVTSKGGFTSPQSQWSEMHLREKANMGAFCVGDTYLMEAIYRADRKVVRYDFEGLIVLAAYAADGRAYTREEVEAVAAESGLRCVERLHYASFKEMLQAVSQFDRDREGCVAHFVDTDYRVKAKGAEYLRVMRILSRVTPVSVWEVMLDGDAAAMRREIPEEFWGDFDAIAGAIEKRLSDTIAAIDRECERLADKSNREIAAAIDTIPEPARRFVLTRRKRGALMMTDKITRRAVFQTFRPSKNPS